MISSTDLRRNVFPYTKRWNAAAMKIPAAKKRPKPMKLIARIFAAVVSLEQQGNP